MEIFFSKYQGVGNDFIMIDNRELFFPKKNYSLINKMCDRRFGIGADGLILLENEQDFDFKMVYFNSDGKESTMCGNGGRCIVAFAKQLDIIEKETRFSAIDGSHLAKIQENEEVSLGMMDVDKVEQIDKTSYFLFTGSPHYVKIIDSFPTNFIEQAKLIRNSNRFIKEGVNVNFIIVDNNKIQIRTYERGVEGETLACGTGAVAAAVVANTVNYLKGFEIITQGGILYVSFINGYKKVKLIGNAKFVFKGFFKY